MQTVGKAQRRDSVRHKNQAGRMRPVGDAQRSWMSVTTVGNDAVEDGASGWNGVRSQQTNEAGIAVVELKFQETFVKFNCGRI